MRLPLLGVSLPPAPEEVTDWEARLSGFGPENEVLFSAVVSVEVGVRIGEEKSF